MSAPHALIIDDTVTNLEVLASLLATAGVTHTAVKDPTHAIEKLAGLSRLDVIFCDLEMPGLTGYDLLKELRAQLGTSVPIIAYSVHTSEIAMTRKKGFDGFLAKPIDAQRFPAQLKRILNGQPVWEMS